MSDRRSIDSPECHHGHALLDPNPCAKCAMENDANMEDAVHGLRRAVPRYEDQPGAGFPELIGSGNPEAHNYAPAVILPTDAKARKAVPMARGVLDYFPRALAAVAELSRIGNDQHNPGQPMHWAIEKSTDHADCILRHMADRGTIDTDKVRHSTKVGWRAFAQLEIELRAEEGDPEAIRQIKELGTEAHKARLRKLGLLP